MIHTPTVFGSVAYSSNVIFLSYEYSIKADGFSLFSLGLIISINMFSPINPASFIYLTTIKVSTHLSTKSSGMSVITVFVYPVFCSTLFGMGRDG